MPGGNNEPQNPWDAIQDQIDGRFQSMHKEIDSRVDAGEALAKQDRDRIKDELRDRDKANRELLEVRLSNVKDIAEQQDSFVKEQLSALRETYTLATPPWLRWSMR